MDCVFCGGQTHVIDSTNTDRRVYRKRICAKCGGTYYTEERVISDRDNAQAILKQRQAEYRETHKERKHEQNREYYKRMKEKV